MSSLFIGSTGNHAGQSLVGWAISRRLVEKGLRVGFMKPFGTDPARTGEQWTDQDALLFKEVLGIQQPLDRICPYLLSENAWRQKDTDEILDEFKSLAHELCMGKDVLLVIGAKHIFFDETSCPIPDTALVKALGSDFILVDRCLQPSTSIYSILSVTSLLRERVKGIILNRVPPDNLDDVKSRVIPSLVQKGIPIIAALAEDPALSSRSLEEIRELLDGKLLFGKESLGRPVGGMTVGSADLKGELKLLKRVYNKIVLLEPAPPDTGAEGPPAQRAISGILLTGGRNPAPQVLEATKKANIPLMLVKDDTFAAMERLEQSSPSLSPKDEFKVRCFTEMMDYDGALDRLLQSLGLIL